MSKSLVLSKDVPETPNYNKLSVSYSEAEKLVEDIILKNHITKLSSLSLVPIDNELIKNNISENVRLFKINEMVYQKDEYSTYKFASVFNSVQDMDCAVFLIADSDGKKTDFYMGVRSLNSKRTPKSLKNTLENSLLGQFPGIKTENILEDNAKEVISNIKANSIASVSCVANNKDEEFTTNENFLQGLEKLTLAMQGKSYTAIVIANGSTQNQLVEIRNAYENIYSKLSPFANMQVSYGENEALSISSAFSKGKTEGISNSESTSSTQGSSTSESKSISKSISESSDASKTLRGLAVSASMASAALAPATSGISLAVGGVVAGAAGLASIVVDKQQTKTEGTSLSESTNSSETVGETKTTNEGTSETNTETKGLSSGSSKNIQLTMQNKTIIGTLERIDLQLERIQECESLGMWECAAYFLSDTQESAEMAASTYKALMKGENSGVEKSAMNHWGRNSKESVEILKDYITNFMHPVFSYPMSNLVIPVTPCSLISGNELAIHMGLPRESVCGFPVIEHAEFGKEVVRYDDDTDRNSQKINLGRIFNMGRECENSVKLDLDSLTMHTFITGSTGSGKSNTVYELLEQLNRVEVPFLVIEPVKGEYKNVFGNCPDVTVLGTNPDFTELLRINPFKFPKGVHVLEHVDRLIEIFNVCWPMYAAMPAILKEATLQSYHECGWDLVTSTNRYSDTMFPTFVDLQEQITEVIESSAYSQELKSNYIGSLVTRIKSLTNGLNGQMFSSDETDNETLFDSNIIVDLSRIGSLETKSLIMGVLIVRLNEYRMCFSEGMNQPLRHITVLEEAHNILKRTSTEQNSEGSNVTGKAVELLSNSIAEMRTYGEGFVIIDQSPNAVDMSAIRNTNTKIVMRLPDEADRRLVGKASGLRDEQLDEISKLPKGVSVVYQNGWVEPVLCKINNFDGHNDHNETFEFTNNNINGSFSELEFNTEILKFLLKGRVNEIVSFNPSVIERQLSSSPISTKNKMLILEQLREHDSTNNLRLWSTDRFGILSELVSSILDSKTTVEYIVSRAESNEHLTRELLGFIDKKTTGLSERIAIGICHCFMRQNSEHGQDRLEIYATWKHYVENRGALL